MKTKKSTISLKRNCKDDRTSTISLKRNRKERYINTKDNYNL